MRRVLALGMALVLLPAAPVPATPVVEFLHIEANEGGSSGGHAALRLDDRVYHFEHLAPGLLRMRRTTADAFVYAYATLGNRPIHGQRLSVDAVAYTQLRNRLSRRQLAQDAQLELYQSLQRDVALFDRGAAAEDVLRIPAAGLFSDRTVPDDLDAAATLRALEERIRRTHGAAFLGNRAARLRTDMEQLPLRAAADCEAPIDAEAFPTCARPVSSRWLDLATAARALVILREHRVLRVGSYHAQGTSDFQLSSAEVAGLRSQAEELEADLVALAASSRTDWGFGFVLGMARLIALRATVAQQQLIVIGDAQAALGHVATFAGDPAFLDIVRAIASEAEADWHALRASAGHATAFREGDYTALELATHRVIALRATIAGIPPAPEPREIYPGDVVRHDETWPLAHASGGEIERARAVAAAYAHELERAYGYNLVTRNCVTELVTLVDATLATDDAPNLARPLGFIPFVASDVIAGDHAAARATVQRSYRARRIAEMSQVEPPIRVALRESNTLTSRIYRPWSRDSTFLFFTSDRVWTRPLFGIVNVMVGAGATLLGAMRAPLEGPRPLVAGARGVLYSLPELAFVNIRKGTFAFVPTQGRCRSVDACAAAP